MDISLLRENYWLSSEESTLMVMLSFHTVNLLTSLEVHNPQDLLLKTLEKAVIQLKELLEEISVPHHMVPP